MANDTTAALCQASAAQWSRNSVERLASFLARRVILGKPDGCDRPTPWPAMRQAISITNYYPARTRQDFLYPKHPSDNLKFCLLLMLWLFLRR
jgi:hypothetical protein